MSDSSKYDYQPGVIPSDNFMYWCYLGMLVALSLINFVLVLAVGVNISLAIVDVSDQPGTGYVGNAALWSGILLAFGLLEFYLWYMRPNNLLRPEPTPSIKQWTMQDESARQAFASGMNHQRAARCFAISETEPIQVYDGLFPRSRD